MKKLIPFLFLVSTPAYADITHSIQSVVSVSTLGASSTATRIGTTFSSSGTNVTPSANSTDNAIGTLNLAAAGITDGVPALDYDTTYTVKEAGDAYSKMTLTSDKFSYVSSILTSAKLVAATCDRF